MDLSIFADDRIAQGVDTGGVGDQGMMFGYVYEEFGRHAEWKQQQYGHEQAYGPCIQLLPVTSHRGADRA